MRRSGLSAFIAGGLWLLVVGVAPAQQSGGGFGGNSSGGSGGFTGNSGNSGGGFTGSSGGSGGFTGSSGGSGGFTGGSTGNSGMGRTGSATGTSTTGSTSPFGKYYGNPIYSGINASNTNSGSKTTFTPTSYPSSITGGFGTPIYDSASLTRSANQGTTALGRSGATGTQGSVTTATFGGASSAGLRRAPGYVTEPVFDMPVRPALETIRPSLQGVVSRATRLPSRDNIRVLTEGDTVVLRGQVRDERERRLAEAMIRLSPGVRTVRNELEPAKKPPANE